MVKCSRCGLEGHNRRSRLCTLAPVPQQQQQPTNHVGTLFPFTFLERSTIEEGALHVNRILIHSSHFIHEFLDKQLVDQENDDSNVFLVELTNPENNKKLVVNVEAGHNEVDINAVYAPSWILENLNMHEPLPILWERVRSIPARATSLSLKALNPIMHQIDARAAIEAHLLQCNVIQENTTIPVPIDSWTEKGEQLVVDIYVEKVVPCEIALLRNEVVLDLIIESEPEPEPEPLPEIPVGIWRPTEELEQKQEQKQEIPSVQPPTPAERRRLAAEAALKRFNTAPVLSI